MSPESPKTRSLRMPQYLRKGPAHRYLIIDPRTAAKLMLLCQCQAADWARFLNVSLEEIQLPQAHEIKEYVNASRQRSSEMLPDKVNSLMPCIQRSCHGYIHISTSKNGTGKVSTTFQLDLSCCDHPRVQ